MATNYTLNKIEERAANLKLHNVSEAISEGDFSVEHLNADYQRARVIIAALLAERHSKAVYMLDESIYYYKLPEKITNDPI